MKKSLGLFIAAVVGLGVFSIVFGSWYVVEQGERAVVLTTGKVTAVTVPGLHFKIPLFQTIRKMSVRTEKAMFPHVAAYSKDIQPSESVVTVNYHLDPGAIEPIYTQYGPAYVDRIVTPRILENVKEAFGQYVAADIVTQRQKLGLQIEKTLAAAMPEGISIDGVQIENIDFSDAYEQAIEQAMQAEAEVRKFRNQLEREKVQAETIVVQAKGNADATRERARAEADAIRLRDEAEAAAIKARGEALGNNPNLVTLIAAEKWDGKLPVTQVPGSATPFISIPNKP